MRKLFGEKDALSENNRNLYTIIGRLRSFRSVGRRLFRLFHVCCPIEISAKKKKNGNVIKGICIFVLIDRIDKKRLQLVVDQNEVTIIFLIVFVH